MMNVERQYFYFVLKHIFDGPEHDVSALWLITRLTMLQTASLVVAVVVLA